MSVSLFGFMIVLVLNTPDVFAPCGPDLNCIHRREGMSRVHRLCLEQSKLGRTALRPEERVWEEVETLISYNRSPLEVKTGGYVGVDL